MIPIARPFVGDEEAEAVSAVVKSGFLTQGEKVAEFEKKFSSYIGTKNGIACSSGTDALEVGLEALGIGKGDEVITTPFTFIATANAILSVGAKPVFADIDPRTFNIDHAKVSEKVSGKTRAVLAVHLYGQPCEMNSLCDLCEDKGILLVEDCAQAHGAEYHGKKVGTFGDLSTFSFYATKNMVTGEGGMVLTDNGETSERLRMIINQGQKGRYDHRVVGYNSRMTEMQAAMGIVQLGKLDKMNASRAENADYYKRNLAGAGLVELPYTAPGAKHVWHQYTLRVPHEERESFMNHLEKNGVGARIYYPRTVNAQKAYRDMGYKTGLYPAAEKSAEQVVSIPVHPSIKKTDLKNIAEAVKSYR